jgi:hypothetical protein
MMRCLGGLALALLITAQAGAAEVVTTAEPARTALPPPAAATVPPLSAWSGLPLAPDAPPLASAAPAAPGCNEVSDRKPHGEVWAGAGTHGYRDVGTAMTAPVGKCGSVSIMVDRTEGGFNGWRR